MYIKCVVIYNTWNGIVINYNLLLRYGLNIIKGLTFTYIYDMI